ncbi:MAG TPA: cytochrome c [Silvibacterium sp.]|nr:cytochrome c [Silvibacterium sp.]
MLAITAAGVGLLFAAGCRQDMQNQPKMIPQRESEFFADGRSVRPQVVGSVARDQLHEDEYFYTGLVDGKEQDALPFPATMQVLERGQERFNVYCTPCHSRVGNGLGMIVMRGYKPAGNYHDAKRLAEPLSHYFFVMTNGYGAMPDYSAQITPVDRWAVAAYIRALQLSQNATQADVPAGTQIGNLSDIADKEGHPEWAGPWKLPSTAVFATPETGIAAGAPSKPANAPNPTIQNPSNAGSSTTHRGEGAKPVTK